MSTSSSARPQNRGQALKLRRLGWAGIEIEYDGRDVVIDLLEEHEALSPALRLEQPLPPPSRVGAVDLALVSHLHADHTDAAALRRALAPGAPVYRPEPGTGPSEEDVLCASSETALKDEGLTPEPVAVWESRTVGPFLVTACPAVDGLGAPQVSWVVDTGDRRVFHGGDTMFHGFWWSIVQHVGPIDVACLPINGPILTQVPGQRRESPLPAVLLPEQASVAAHLLGASTVVPIHYGLDRPPLYAETPDAVGRFERSARDLGLTPLVLDAAQEITV